MLSSVTTTELHYQRGTANARTLQAEFDAILAEMPDDRDVPAAIRVTEGSQGCDPIATIIIITVISHTATKVFDEVIWPKLKDRLAHDALGRAVSDDDSNGA
jgi:hypothetical protein